MPTTVRDRLLADHARLERALEALENAAEGAQEDELIRVWQSFESGLRAHLDAEETHILPLVEDVTARATVEADHAAIRESLDQLGLQVELHAVREEQVDAFLAQLRAHKEREETGLYADAEDKLAEPDRQTLLDRLSRR